MYRLRSVLYESGMNRRAVGLKRNPTCSDTLPRTDGGVHCEINKWMALPAT